jgi:hypothetical protein
MSDKQYDRRSILKGALAAGVAGIPIAVVSSRANAQAQSKLDAKDPQAIALGYVVDATKVDSKTNPTFKPEQNCANCLQLMGKVGDAFRPCNLFPGKVVASAGWCRAWVKKP